MGVRFRTTLPAPSNHRLKTSWINFKNAGNEIPALTAHPDDDKKYPAVLCQHGRRGLDNLVRYHVKCLAACGFVVQAAYIYGGHYIKKLAIAYDGTLKLVVARRREGKDVAYSAHMQTPMQRSTSRSMTCACRYGLYLVKMSNISADAASKLR